MQELRGEIFIYDLLARIYSHEPTLELLRELAAMKLPPATEEHASKGILQMVEAARFRGEDLQGLNEELSVEFTRLFLGPIKPVAIPYASWYLSESRQLMTDDTIDVRRRYLDAGMAVRDLYSTPDDHIGIELEFLCHLTREMVAAHEAGDGKRASELEDARNGFVEDHLKQWVPGFIASIADSDASRFYRGAALLLDEAFMISAPLPN